MPRLVINPGTPQAWEIQLKPGLNFLGRGPSNDFKIEDGSVSGSHCQIIVENGATTIKDMGSTNGTYVNRAKVMESRLESGQPLRLGSVDMIFYSDGPDAVTAHVVPPPPTQAAPPSPPVAPPVPKISGLKISGLAHATPAPAATVVTTDAPPPEDSLHPAAPAEVHGTRYCKFHPKAPARYLCNKCNRTFCELCVTSRNVGAKTIKTCRSCGVECVPVQFEAAAQKSFYARLAGSFGYPLRGIGILIIVCAAVAYAALTLVSLYTLFGFIIAILIYGGIFLFMQNIIHTTTSDEEEDIGFPDFGGAFGAAFQLFVTFIASFWLWIALTIAKLLNVDIPIEAIIAGRIIGLIYFPMALLAVAMKDSAMAANPLIVLPAMMKAPVEYGITVLFLFVVYGVSLLGDALTTSNVDPQMMLTRDMSALLSSMAIKAAVGLVTVYLLSVTMRILGLFYNASKQKLGWFGH
jgi:hypothetical protein